MKNLRKTVNESFDSLDNRWRALPLRKQHRYILLLFMAYLMLTIGIIIKVGHDVKMSKKESSIESIDNPIIKKQNHERKR